MNPQEFDARYLEITKYQRPVLNGFLQGDCDAEIATRIGSTPANVRQHLRKICQIFEIGNLPGESERYRHDLVELFIKHKPDLVADTWKQKLSNKQPQTSINYPSGAVPLDRGTYIERGSIEIEIEKYMSEPRALIRILAPSKFGKTSLCFRIKAHAQAQDYRAVYINLKQSFDRDCLSKFELFLQHFCSLVNEELDLKNEPDWDDNYGSSRNFNRYIEKILKQSDFPLLLILDGVESIYSAEAVNQNFFQMMRSWHDKGADPQKVQWTKIRQIIAYSSENYGDLDYARSPFNIGRLYELTEFTEANIRELANKYRLNVDEDRIVELRSLVGGHPYLVNLVLYHFALDPNFTLAQIVNETQDYLHSIANRLHRDSELKLALKRAIDAPAGVAIYEDKLKYVLYSIGIIKEENSRVRIRCELFDRYFRNYFASDAERQ